MFVLQIEHSVRKFEEWKKAFDSDPVGRKRGGVQRYRILRPTDDSEYVIVELEFITDVEAERMLSALRELWGKVEGTLIEKARARIVQVAAEEEL